MMRRRIHSVGLGITLAVLMVVLVPNLTVAASEGKPVVLKALSCFATNHASVRYLGVLADMVKDRSKGELEIKWIGGPEATKMFEQPKALQMGAIDFLLTAPAFYQSLLPMAYAFDQSKYSAVEERERGVYDFWMKHQGSDFKTALGELAGMLLA